MLPVDFNIQTPKDSKSFIFKDTTDYGQSNISIGDIVETKLTVVFPGGAEYGLFSTYLPVQGEWEAEAESFSDNNKIVDAPDPSTDGDCGCGGSVSNLGWGTDLGIQKPLEQYPQQTRLDICEPEGVIAEFMDGCYTFTYEVFAVSNVPDMLCDYEINVTICEGQRLFIFENGVWKDVTLLAVNVNNNLTYTKNNTADTISLWQVKSAPETIVKSGTVDATNCRMEDGEGSFSTPKLVGSKQYVVPFMSKTMKKLSQKAFDVSIGCEDGYGTIGSELNIFLLAQAKMDAIINNPSCGCTCIEETMRSVSFILDSITSKTDACLN